MLDTYYMPWPLEGIGIINEYNLTTKLHGLLPIFHLVIYSSNQHKLHNMKGETDK